MSWWNKEKLKNLDAIICDGAVRSGKTLSIVAGFFLWSMASFENQVFALCGKTVGALRRNILMQLPGWLGSAFTVKEHRGENKLVVTAFGRKNTYYLFGGQDEAAYTLIQGITLAGVLLDEVVLMPRSFVEQACARCSVPGSKLWFSCNPASSAHWFYREWIVKHKQKNALYLHFTMADNPALTDAVRQRYSRLYTGLFYRRYVLGQWCAGEGLVYAFDPEKHIAKEIPPFGSYYISVDYGTQNPFSAGLWLVAGGKAYRIREFYYNGREKGIPLTDSQYCEEVKKLAGDLPIRAVVVDPSAASFIAALRQAGFSVRRASNAVLPGIRQVSEYLHREVLQFSPACRDSIREFGLYAWEAEGEDRPQKQDDHAMDDIRYFCTTILRRIL